MPPRSKIGGQIVFALSVILYFCHSVLLSETLTLLITFEQWMLELWYFTWVFLVIRSFHGYNYYFTLWPWPGVWPIFWKITFERWALELWYFTWVFLVISPFCGHHYSLLCDLDLGVWRISENFNLAYNFFTVSARTLIYIRWVFEVTTPFLRYQHFYLVTMTLEFVPCCNVITFQLFLFTIKCRY